MSQRTASRPKTDEEREAAAIRRRLRIENAYQFFEATPEAFELRVFLNSNDKRFYGSRTTVSAALKEFGKRVDPDVFKRFVYECCEFWQNKELPKSKMTCSTTLSAKQWEKVISVCKRIATTIDDSNATLEFCVRVISSESRVGLNKRLLMNSSVFHQVTKGRFKGE